MADQTATSRTSGGEGANKEVTPVVQPQLEVRTMREVASTSWPMLTRTNYGEWAVHMKWKLRARKLWAAVDVGGAGEDAEVGAMEALLASTPAEYHEAIGSSQGYGEGGMGHARFVPCRLGAGQEGEGAAAAPGVRRPPVQVRRVGGGFALRLQSLASQLATYGKPIDDEDVVAKLLRVVPSKYAQLALSIETMLDMSELMLEDVTGRLRAVEDRSDAAPEKK